MVITYLNRISLEQIMMKLKDTPNPLYSELNTDDKEQWKSDKSFLDYLFCSGRVI